MRRRKNGDSNHNINLGMPYFDQRPGLAAGVLITLFCCGGIFAWLYMLSLDSETCSKILGVAITVNILMLVGNVIGILFKGYDTYGQNFLITWILNIVFTVIGFGIRNIGFLTSSGNAADGVLFQFLQLMISILVAALISVIPTMLICGIMWIIMEIFG